jgi:hypothetical protein
LEVEGAVHVETQEGAGPTEGYKGDEGHFEEVDDSVFGRDVEADVGCPGGDPVVVKRSGRASNEQAGVTAEMVADEDKNGTAGSCWDGHSEPSAVEGECIESVAAR